MSETFKLRALRGDLHAGLVRAPLFRGAALGHSVVGLGGREAVVLDDASAQVECFLW